MFLTIAKNLLSLNELSNPKEENPLTRKLLFLKIMQKWEIRRNNNPVAYSLILITTQHGTSIWE